MSYSHLRPHAHPHSHPHDHEHAPEHGHPHEHGTEAPLQQAELKPGAGKNRVLFFDAFSGVSGDMTLSALLDLGVPMSVLQDCLSKLPVQGYRLERGQKWSSGIGATTLSVLVDQPQPERTWTEIDAMLESAPLQEPVRQLARQIFLQLAQAEAQVHRISIDRVHFHEVGAVDAIVDIVGAAALLCWLAPSEVVCAPLPMGRGMVRARHGVLPLPAPAALVCLQGVPTYPVDLQAELVTPTGAAIVRTVASRFAYWPSMCPERVGMGAGTKDLGERPNLLRLVLGQDLAQLGTDLDPASHLVLEVNVDDMTGELVGHAIETLMGQGALDVWATATTTKKGRPGLVLSVLSDRAHSAQLEQALLRETTSLGVRRYGVSRLERPRSLVSVQTPYGAISLKVSGGGLGPEQVKPEFSMAQQLARQAGVPVREVLLSALVCYRARQNASGTQGPG